MQLFFIAFANTENYTLISMPAITSVRTIADAFDERTRFYMRAASLAINIIVCDVADCPSCGAVCGQYCLGRYGRSISANGRHADRCSAVAVWRKAHPKEWKRLKDQAFRMIVKARGRY